jgi:hypothetical protein
MRLLSRFRVRFLSGAFLVCGPWLVPAGSAIAGEEPGGEDLPPAEEEAAVEEPGTVWDSLQDSLFKGDVIFDLRLRAEIVEQSDLDTAQAYTERLRLGYATSPFYGFSFLVEFEDTRAADYDLYNAAGLNNEPDKAVVADPENTEMNRFLARYENEYFGGVAGRQRIKLDDLRFIGNVGWRQNEQTYDAYTLSSEWIEDTTLFYSYVDDVNRIFGQDGTDWRSDSHLLNASYNGLVIGRITGFAYFLDFSNSDLNSSNTVGLRLAGTQDLTEKLEASYAFSYAYQVDAGNNPANYEADYYSLKGSLGWKKLGALGVGYEVLGSDSGDFGFRTPLATLHAFNGWADQFLTTPAEGLEDLYFFADMDLPFDIRGKTIFHLFFSDDSSRDLGGEFDASLGKAITENISVLGKLAVFYGEADLVPNNVQKYWIQTEIKF